MNITAEWFNDSNYHTGPSLTDEMVQHAESELGIKLPFAYIELLRVKNGGTPRIKCYPTKKPTGWAEDHIQVEVIFGISGKRGIDTKFGSRYLITEWGYPDVGVVIGETPSAGHEAIMLDYNQCSVQGEPRVIYVDTETTNGKPDTIELAPNFATFISGFVSCDSFRK